jgi:ADP-heptose:LPS heptosyltransferase
MAETLGAKVVLEVHASLVPLLSTLKGNFTIIEKGKDLPDFDMVCPVMSLPLAFKTTVETIPASVPYLYVNQDKQAEWHQRLGNKTRPRVGLVWSGSMANKIDLNPCSRRNIPLEQLQPIFQLPIEFHVLQTEVQPEDAAVLSNLKHIHTHQNDLKDFSDTAALVHEMDLVISVCTSVAHLAGAMGQSTWILLPFSPDFRWMLDRTDSPWYPTATLIRQTEIGNWSGVISEVTQRLQAKFTD